MQGIGAPPEWYLWMRLAEDWQRPPWELEQEAPALWIDRWIAMQNASQKPRNLRKGTKGKRLI